MFAGLPGIGVGTLFYVLMALWMPLREIGMVARGQSSVARWKLIGTQLVFALGIVASIAAADRVLLWGLGGGSPRAVGPARWLNDHLGAHAPQTILAAPVTASLLLLGLILLAVEAARVTKRVAARRPRPAPASVAMPHAPSEASAMAAAHTPARGISLVID